MPDIQTSGPAAKLRALFDLVGSSPAPFLSPEIVPVVLLNDLSEGSIGLSLLDLPAQVEARRYVAFDGFTGAIGFRPRVRLINPASSGILCRPFLMIAQNSLGAQEFFISEPFANVPVIASPGKSIDGRFTADGACGLFPDSTGAAGIGEFRQTCGLQPDVNDLFMMPGYVVSPGQVIQFTFSPPGVNTFSMMIFWDELQIA